MLEAGSLTPAESACGTCSLCCTLMRVAMDPPKPERQACEHCTGIGCGIYSDRPEICAGFQCLWLASQSMSGHALAEALRPDRAGVVIDLNCAGTVIAHCERVDSWEREPMRSWLLHHARRTNVILELPGGAALLTPTGRTEALAKAGVDPEDELYTLREKYDFVIVGGAGADAPATVAGAAGLARAALEHGFSVIARLNDLGADAPAYVARFVHALIGAPQSLWRPAIVAIDELQRFAPREGSTDASGEIVDLVNRGRKRDLTLVGASLRMTSIDPAVRAMVNNWLLGRVGQTLDRNTMADQLGFTRGEARELLRGLKPRQFWALGPAVADEPLLFHVDDVETTPVRRGQAKPATPPAPEAMREILAGIAAAAPAAELPDDVIPADPLQALIKGGDVGRMIADRDNEIARLDARVVDLQAEVAILVAELDELRGVDRECDRYAAAHNLLNEIMHRMQDGIPLPTTNQFLAAFGEMQPDNANLHETAPTPPAPDAADAPPVDNPAEPGLPLSRAAGGTSKAEKPEIQKARKPESQKSGPAALNKTARDAAELLRGIGPDGLAWNDVLLVLGRRPDSGDSRQARKALFVRGLIRTAGDQVLATQDLLDDSSVPFGAWPAPEDLLALWSDKLRGPGGAILLDLAANGAASATDVAARLDRSATSGWWRSGLKDLRNSNLVRDVAGKLELHEFLRPQADEQLGDGRNGA